MWFDLGTGIGVIVSITSTTVIYYGLVIRCNLFFFIIFCFVHLFRRRRRINACATAVTTCRNTILLGPFPDRYPRGYFTRTRITVSDHTPVFSTSTDHLYILAARAWTRQPISLHDSRLATTCCCCRFTILTPARNLHVHTRTVTTRKTVWRRRNTKIRRVCNLLMSFFFFFSRPERSNVSIIFCLSSYLYVILNNIRATSATLSYSVRTTLQVRETFVFCHWICDCRTISKKKNAFVLFFSSRHRDTMSTCAYRRASCVPSSSSSLSSSARRNRCTTNRSIRYMIILLYLYRTRRTRGLLSSEIITETVD